MVIAVLAILMSLLLPSLSRTRYSAETLMCSNNLKQIGLGISMYTNDHNDFYPDTGGIRGRPAVIEINSTGENTYDVMLPYYENSSLAMRDLFMCPHVKDGWKARMELANWGHYEEFPFRVSDSSGRIPYNLYFNLRSNVYSCIGHNDEMMTSVGDRWKAGFHLVINVSDGKYSNVLASDIIGSGRGNHLPMQSIATSPALNNTGSEYWTWHYPNTVGNANYLLDDYSILYSDEIYGASSQTTGGQQSLFHFPIETFRDDP